MAVNDDHVGRLQPGVLLRLLAVLRARLAFSVDALHDVASHGGNRRCRNLSRHNKQEDTEVVLFSLHSRCHWTRALSSVPCHRRPTFGGFTLKAAALGCLGGMLWSAAMSVVHKRMELPFAENQPTADEANWLLHRILHEVYFVIAGLTAMALPLIQFGWHDALFCSHD